MKKHYLRLVRRAFRALRHPRLRHRPWWQRLSAPLFRRTLWKPCRDSVASGLAAGLFFSMMPMPFQTVPAALFALRFRGNIPIAMGATWLTNPFTLVPVTWFQFALGEWLRTMLSIPMPDFLVQADLVLPGVGHCNAAGFVLGFLTSGVLAALAAFPLVHLFAAVLPHYLPVRRHRPVPPKPAKIPG